MRTFEGTAGAGSPRLSVSGWVVEAADSEVAIRDQDGVVTLSIEGVADDFSPADLAVESIVTIDGDVLDRGEGCYAIESASVTVHSEPDRKLPLDPATAPAADIETRLDHRHLDLRGERQQAIFEIRSAVVRAIRTALYDWGAIECDLPLLVPGVMEAKNQQFAVEYFDTEVRLVGFHTSQYKQLLASGGVERLFAIQKIFGYDDDAAEVLDLENGGSPKSVNETTTLHVESAFTDHWSFLDRIEDLVVSVHEHVTERCQDELATLDCDLVVPERDFPRLTYDEAIDLANEDLDDPLAWGEDLGGDASRVLGERVDGYYFVVDWPADLRDFYARKDGSIAHSFDLMHPEMELMSGCQREHRHDPLRAAIEAEPVLDADQLKFYLDAFRDGVPPHSGGVLGLDRFLMAMLELENIREVIPFPRDRQRTV